MGIFTIIHLLAFVSLTLMTGVEICVAVFVEPVLRSLRERVQLEAVPCFAAALGKVMPFWYASSLLLTAVDAWLHFHHALHGRTPLVSSAVLQALTILATITILVPINNRLAKMREAYPGWLRDAQRWDAIHRFRVVALLIAVTLLAFA